MKRRSKYIVKKRFQLRFALEMVAIIVLVPLAVWVNYLMLGQYVLVDAGTLQPDAGITSSIGALFQHQWGWMVLMYFISVAVTAFCMILYTHRVAGPMYRMEKGLKAFAAGQMGYSFSLRKGDYFADLSEDISRTVNSFTSTIRDITEKSEKLQKAAEKSDDTDLRHCSDNIRQILNEYQASEN